MACSLCVYTGEDCPDCGECFCECRCEDEYGGRDPCFHCGSRSCAGYCDDYQTYNLRPAETGGEPGSGGYVTTPEEDAYMAEHHPTALLIVGPPGPSSPAAAPSPPVQGTGEER
jgi:hypothetical protein